MAVDLNQVVYELTVDDRGAQQAADRAAGALDRVADAHDDATAASKRQASGFEVLNRITGELTRAQSSALASLNRWKATADPAERAVQNLARAERDLDRAIRQGISTEEEKLRVLDQLSQRYGVAGPAADTFGRAQVQAAATSGRMGNAIQQAGFQVGDFAVQVASGQGVLRPFIQQGTQLISMFGPWGAVIGAAGAALGALYVGLSSTTAEASAAEDATKRLTDALKSSATEAQAAASAENMLAEAVEVSSKSAGDLTAMSFDRVVALQRQQDAALATGQAEVTRAKSALLAAELDAQAQALMAGAAGGEVSEETTRSAELRGEVERLTKAYDELTAARQRSTEAAVNAFDRDFAAPLQAQVEHQERLALALRQGADAVRKVNTEEQIRIELARAAVTADSTRGQQIVSLIRQKETLAAANDDYTASEQRAEAAAKRAAEEQKRLSTQRAETFAELQDDLRYQRELREAHMRGEEAINAVADAREVELIVQKLKLDQNSIEAGQIRELIQRRGEEQRAIEGITDAQKAAEKAAKDLAREQEKAAEEAVRAYDKVIDSIANISQEKLGDALFSTLKGETLDFAEFFKNTILRAVADVAAAALTQQIVIPIAAQAVGAFPSLFGLTGQAAGVAQSAAGGIASNPLSALSSISNLFTGGPGSLATSFATSGVGAALGLSQGTAFAAGVAPVAGGLTNAAAAGTAGLSSLTGAGSALVAAAPYAAIAAIALPILMGMFGGGPTVGPVGIADFSPGLGRRRAFDVPGIDPFTADNGGNGEAMRPIAEAIADLIADSADRFSATIEQSLRFRVANYQGPESGSGRAAGFEVNAFINQEAERRVAEGLSQEQAIFEALQFAVKEAFTFDSATIAEAAANVSATTTEELLGKLEFADSFERISTALDELGQGITVNTLTLAQNTVAVQDQAREFVEGAAGPIVDYLKTALELFPAEVTRQEGGRRSVRSVIVGQRGDDERYLNPGDDGYDAAIDAPGARVLDRIIGISEEVTAQSENYAANLERIRDATGIAVGSVDQLLQQITGEFEPAVRGPFTEAFDQGRARIEEMGAYIEKVNDQIAAANEAFPGLDQALINTTTVLLDAATALEETLRADYADSITRQTNAATGLGAVNVINDLLDSRDANIADAITLGVSSDPANKLFDVQLRQSLNGAGLSDLNDILVSGQILDAGAKVIVDTILQEQALTFARSQQAVALQEEISGMQSLLAEHERFADAANDNARTLRQAAASMLVDSNLSPLSPIDRLAESERQLLAAIELASDTDPTDAASRDAISRLPALVQTDNELARDYYASSKAYAARFNRNQDLLISTADRQESIGSQQLSALRDIESAIQGMGGPATGSAAQQAAAGGFNFGNATATNQQIYNALTAAGLQTPSAFGGGQLDALRQGNPAVNAVVTAMGFATGGSFTIGGASGNDNLMMPPVRVTAGEVVNVSRGDHMGDLLDEVRALRRENAANARQIASITAGGSLRVAGAVQEGNATTKRMASATERNAARPAA